MSFDRMMIGTTRFSSTMTPSTGRSGESARATWRTGPSREGA
jgi:hypothetical protein